MMSNELLLKTAFCCMACDGEIAQAEVELVKKYAKEQSAFKDMDVENILNGYVEQINSAGASYLAKFLEEVSSADLNEAEELSIVKLAIEMIEADQNIEYSEIRFFKQIREQLKVSDEVILAELPDKEDYLLPDVKKEYSYDTLQFSFNSISIS